MTPRLPSEARRFAAELEDGGWVFVRRCGSGHLLFAHPNGARITIALTPSTYRSRIIERVRARRLGRQS